MRDLLDTIEYIAELNAAEAKAHRLSRLGSVSAARRLVLEEEREWQALLAKVEKQREVLGVEDAPDEDDAEALIEVMDMLKATHRPLTVFEIVQRLQRADVLSLEFTAAARQQAMALLLKLRDGNQICADQHGRWSLVPNAHVNVVVAFTTRFSGTG